MKYHCTRCYYRSVDCRHDASVQVLVPLSSPPRGLAALTQSLVPLSSLHRGLVARMPFLVLLLLPPSHWLAALMPILVQLLSSLPPRQAALMQSPVQLRSSELVGWCSYVVLLFLAAADCQSRSVLRPLLSTCAFCNGPPAIRYFYCTATNCRLVAF